MTTLSNTNTPITYDNALAMHGLPVRIESEDGIRYGEIEVHPNGACVRCFAPVGGGAIPGDKFWSEQSFIQRLFPATRGELIDFVQEGKDVTGGWDVGLNTWVTPGDGFITEAIRQVAEVSNRRGDPGFRGHTFYQFTVREVQKHIAYGTYRLLDGTIVEYPVVTKKYLLENGVWVNSLGKVV